MHGPCMMHASCMHQCLIWESQLLLSEVKQGAGGLQIKVEGESAEGTTQSRVCQCTCCREVPQKHALTPPLLLRRLLLPPPLLDPVRGPSWRARRRREEKRRKKGEGKKGASPRMGDAQGAEKGTGNVGEAMLISGHHAACSQALRRGRKWQKSVSQYNVNVHRIGT